MTQLERLYADFASMSGDDPRIDEIIEEIERLEEVIERLEEDIEEIERIYSEKR